MDDLTIALSDARELLQNTVRGSLEPREAVATKRVLREIGQDLVSAHRVRYDAWLPKADRIVDAVVTSTQLEKLQVAQATDQDETQICPICHGKAVSWCKCRIHSCTCDDGHTWYDKDGHTYLGNGHHRLGREVVRDLSKRPPISKQQRSRVDYEPRDLNPRYGKYGFNNDNFVGKSYLNNKVIGGSASKQTVQDAKDK